MSGYQPLIEQQDEQPDEIREEGELEIENNETEEDSIIMRGDNLPIVDFKKVKYRRQKNEVHSDKSHCRKSNHKQEGSRRPYQKAQFEFMMDLNTLISKTAIDPELTRVRTSMRREDRETIPDGYRTVFDKLSIRWGRVFVDDQIVVPIDLRRRLLDILHFGHSRITKKTSEAKIFWWPNKKKNESQGLYSIPSIR